MSTTLQLDYFTQGLLEGKEKVIAEIYSRFFPKALKYVSSNQGDIDSAKDIFQEALLHIIVGAQEKRINIKNFEAYLFTVCKNLWRKHSEKEKKWVIKSEVVPLIDKDTDFAAFFLEQEQMELYREKFNLLSDNCKEILSLFFNNISYDRIIKELSYASINTARQRIFKCKNKLISLIKADPLFKN